MHNARWDDTPYLVWHPTSQYEKNTLYASIMRYPLLNVTSKKDNMQIMAFRVIRSVHCACRNRNKTQHDVKCDKLVDVL